MCLGVMDLGGPILAGKRALAASLLATLDGAAALV